MIYFELLMCLVLRYAFLIQSGNKRSPSPQDLKIIIFIFFPPSLNFCLPFSLSLDINCPSIWYPNFFSQLITLFCAWLPKLEITTSTFTTPLFTHLKLIFKSYLFSFLKSFKVHASLFYPSNDLLSQLTTMSGIEHHISVSLSMFSLSFIESSLHHQVLKPN